MTEPTHQTKQFSDADLEDLVASSDSGARNPIGPVGTFLAIVAITWAVFQIILASPLVNQILPGSWINNSRQIHLAFAVFLAFAAYPAFKSSPRSYIPIFDWILGIVGALIALYGFIFYDKLVASGGLADDIDKLVALAGILILFEAARRALGPAMAILAGVFLVYVFFGSADWIPDVIRWKGASLKKAMSHMWTTQEGVFGIALGVSTKYVFLFVLFGALLEKAGAGNYFIKIAFGALGHLRGGPAKAAVVGSAATGLISGSSIANVVTTGTFTIPLMKRVGFSSEQAGAVEVASSVNGQIMPPVMGAAAFLMVEYIDGASYIDIVKSAFIPALISYIALVYIVHLEAVKRNMPTLGRADGKAPGVLMTAVAMIGFFVGFAGLCWATQFPVGMILDMPGGSLIVAALVVLIYVVLLKFASSEPDLKPDDPNAEEVVLPDVKKIYKSGLYFLLPIVVLVYFLMIERKSPGLSAFWATMLLIVMLLTQKPLKAIFRKKGDVGQAFLEGVIDFKDGLINGSRNMIGIGLATAVAGVIVGTVSLTGIGQVMAAFVEFLSGGNLVIMLVLVAILSLILGMGLPTTANYIVVSSLMVGVIVNLAAQSDLVVPLIAAHLFVFYFGIMADVTPPVGLASFAAAAVSGGDAIKTGFIAFFYSLRTIVLPFVFIFNSSMLLLDTTLLQGIMIFIISTIAVLVFTAGSMGYFLTKSRIYESLIMCIAAFGLFRPDFFIDRVQPPFTLKNPVEVSQIVGEAESGSELKFRVTGPNFDTGLPTSTSFLVTVGEEATADERLTALGIMPVIEGEDAKLEEPLSGTIFFDKMGKFDFYGDEPVMIDQVKVKAVQSIGDWMIYIVSFLLIGLVAFAQKTRMGGRKDPNPIASKEGV